MIVYGTRDVEAVGGGAPPVDLTQTDALEIADGEILQTIFELRFTGFETRVPPAMHPSHPPYATIFFYRAKTSPIGPFTMAQVRVSGMAGISRFSYPIHGWIDNPEAGEVFARRWGYRLDLADITLTRRFDGVWGTVTQNEKLILDAGMYDPEPVSGADATHAGHLNLAYVEGDEPPVPMLIQAGPQLSFTRCDRGRPRLKTYDAEVIGGDVPYFNVSAFAGQCSFLFNPVVFICDPTRPAVEGALTLAGPLRQV
jgi:hypothetical protein